MADTIAISSRGKPMTIKFYPVARTISYGVIIIGYGSDGMNTPWGKMIEEYAELLAEKGFAVLIPDYLVVTNTPAGPGVFPLITEYRDDWEVGVLDAIDYAKSLPKVDSARIGLLGFSLGGHLCIRLRAKAKVLVAFFSPVFDGLGAPGTLRHAQVPPRQSRRSDSLHRSRNNSQQTEERRHFGGIVSLSRGRTWIHWKGSS